MAFEDFTEKECLCDFVHSLGVLEDTFSAFIDSIIAILTATKAAIALWPADLADQLKKIELEAEIMAIEQIMAPIEAPFTIVQSLFKPYADCPPMQSASKTLQKTRDFVLSDLEKEKEIAKELIEGLDLEGSKIEEIDNWIEQLEAIKDAIEFCGQLEDV